jgi:DNA-binding MarR family transcriptional regulator
VNVKLSPGDPAQSSCAEVTKLISDLARVRPELETWPYRIFASAAELTRQITDALGPTFDRMGVKGGDYEILGQLRRSGEPYALSPTELSRLVHFSTGTMTRRLDRLEAIGLLRRLPHPSDRRALIVELTPEGLELADRVLDEILALIAVILAPVRDRTQQFEDLVRDALGGLQAAAGIADASPAAR